MASKDKHLKTAGEVLEVIGVDRAMKLARAKSVTAPGTWRWRNRFTPRSFLAFQIELSNMGYSAPAALWGQFEHRA